MQSFFGDQLPKLNEIVLTISRVDKFKQVEAKKAMVDSLYDTWRKVFRNDENLITKRMLSKKIDTSCQQFQNKVLKYGRHDYLILININFTLNFY